MKTILSTCYKFFENKEDFATFEDIFDFVKEEMKDIWTEQEENLNLNNFIDIKRGEVYQMLVIEGGFTKNLEGNWKLKKL